MNTDTGEIVELPTALRIALATIPQKEFTSVNPAYQTPADRSPQGVITRMENKLAGKTNYDADAVAAQMLARAEQGPLIELRGNPDPKCEECHGKGAAGGGRGHDGKFHPCRCCAMPLAWCNVHNRRATAFQRHGPRVGEPCCDPNLGGIMIPCQVVDLTGLVELSE